MWDFSGRLELEPCAPCLEAESLLQVSMKKALPRRASSTTIIVGRWQSVFAAFFVFCTHGNQGHAFFLGEFDRELVAGLQIKHGCVGLAD